MAELMEPHQTRAKVPCRSLFFIAGAVLAAFAVASVPAAAAVFGTDGRKPVAAPQTIALQSMGTLKHRSSGATCSAACVSDDIIATASHCLFSPTAAKRADRGAADLGAMEFVLATPAQSSAARIAGADIGNTLSSISVGTKHLNLTPPIGAVHDWALIKLDHPICRGRALRLHPAPSPAYTLGTLGSQTAHTPAGSSAEVFQIALHHDLRPNTFYRDVACPIVTGALTPALSRADTDFANASQLIFHQCDTGAASSGSPLLVTGKDGAAIVGINVGTYFVARDVLPSSTGEATNDQALGAAVANTAIRSEVLVAPLRDLQTRHPLTDHRDLVRLQQILKAIGYLQGPIQDQVTEPLTSAVAEFEQAANVPQRQIIDRTLLDQVLQWSERATMVETGSISVNTGAPMTRR